MSRLPHDCCRCQGEGCDRKATCLRHVAMNDMGPATPWTERLCEHGKESEKYIMVREEVKK